jgi:hypothetical protein
MDTPILLHPLKPEQAGRTGRDPQQALRVAQFERAMQAFNEEMGIKMAHAFYAFHREHMQPIIDRLAYLDLPWYAKVWHWMKRQRAAFRLWIESEQNPPAAAPATAPTHVEGEVVHGTADTEDRAAGGPGGDQADRAGGEDSGRPVHPGDGEGQAAAG